MRRSRRNARFVDHARRESHTNRRHKTRFSERLGGKNLFDVTYRVPRSEVRESTSERVRSLQNKETRLHQSQAQSKRVASLTCNYHRPNKYYGNDIRGMEVFF